MNFSLNGSAEFAFLPGLGISQDFPLVGVNYFLHFLKDFSIVYPFAY